MGHTLILWTASLLASQASDAQVINNPADGIGRPCNCQAQQQQDSAPRGGPLGLGILDRLRSFRSDDSAPSEPKLTLWERFQNRFPGVFGNSDHLYDNYGNMQLTEETVGRPHPSAPRAVYSEPPLSQPVTSSSVVQAQYQPAPSSNIQPVAATTTAPAPAPVNVISSKFANKIGHEDDYTWVTGQLGQQNGQWVIYYATPETVDNFGGKLMLNYHGDMSGMQIGDLISVSGGLNAANGRLVGAYQVNSISLIEHR